MEIVYRGLELVQLSLIKVIYHILMVTTADTAVMAIHDCCIITLSVQNKWDMETQYGDVNIDHIYGHIPCARTVI